MIICGEGIESSIGVTLGISVLASAGIGNLFSDIVGLGVGGYIEQLVTKLGIPSPNLSAGQWEIPSTWRIVMWSRVIGISIGCLLGMFPLLFKKSDKNHH